MIKDYNRLSKLAMDNDQSYQYVLYFVCLCIVYVYVCLCISRHRGTRGAGPLITRL